MDKDYFVQRVGKDIDELKVDIKEVKKDLRELLDFRIKLVGAAAGSAAVMSLLINVIYFFIQGLSK